MTASTARVVTAGEGFWKELFGVRHGVLVATSFFKNVSRHAFEKRDLAPGEKPENLVLHFNPQTGQDMLLACLWIAGLL